MATAVVGVGYLGKFHAEKLASLPGSRLVAVADVDQARRDEVAGRLGVEAVADYRDLVDRVDAVSIVVPTHLHYEVARAFLEAGVHVLVEKPITTTVAEARKLIELARERSVVLQVGHLERFNPVVTAMREVVAAPRFIEAYRVAPFKERGLEVNVVLDLMIHDIDIVQTLVGSPIDRVAANGTAVFSEQPDIVNARIQFQNGCVANLTASRVSVKTERKIRLFQHDAYLSADLHEKRLKIYRKVPGGAEARWPEISVEERKEEGGDALRVEIAAFLESVSGRRPPAVTGQEGKLALETAIRVTEMVERSEAAGGA